MSVTSSNRGALLILQGAEVTRGYSFVITCSIYSIYPEGRFFLIFSSSTITETKTAVNYSASFNFPAAQYEHQGNYSCLYEVTLSTRRFNSTESAPITVIVTMTAGVDNNYEDEEDDTYVNVDQVERKEIKEESEDYEDPETDSDHDYEEASPAENNLKSEEMSLSVEDYSDHGEEHDHEEDKILDDEDDYINVYE
ncbi:hypothetical protein Q5P01_016713 [Channa striata]|uniref:Immunoglobulin-like beta-sandwich domain-containing protein n=1 Tax=Channa striata TaxID=64152 RepID=A0AA88M819_CHASR|nr:hypothetical protein Q5P01_016713 [Channa striata]